MSFINSYSNFFRKYFPSPFSIAIILSFVSFLLALFITKNNESFIAYIPKLGTYWFEGMFKDGLLAFTIHMMLILVLGHILALTKTAQKLIDFSLKYATNTANAAYLVCLLTIIVALFNWGLGLIFGAIFARKIAEKFQKENKKLNYPLIAAAAYVGLMVWHGGLSGSAPLTISSDHTFSAQMGNIAISETIFSTMNIFTSIALLVIVPLVMYFLGKNSKQDTIPVLKSELKIGTNDKIENPADFIENSSILIKIVGSIFFLVFILISANKIKTGGNIFSVLNLATTNLLLFSLALIFHKNIKNFLAAVQEAIGDVSGILIQFPLYFGIMGIMKESGLATLIAAQITNTANEITLPIYTFLSAGLLNMFVPSGGGQWQIQAPIIIETAQKTGTSLAKMIMALAYGDQITNMLQPFWALPLLGITGLKAKDILPYSLVLFLTGFIIFTLSLIIF
ncbi:MAG: short-chain fatty acid transporter [Chitinophagales bacterium]